MEKCRLMLVDDDPAIREVLREYVSLCMEEFDVVAEAANGRDAVLKAAEANPDVILMDVRMPLVDGIQATRHIKRERGLHAVVVTFTSYAWTEIKQEAFQAGATLHVQKPFDLDKVKEVLFQAWTQAARQAMPAGAIG